MINQCSFYWLFLEQRTPTGVKSQRNITLLCFFNLYIYMFQTHSILYIKSPALTVTVFHLYINDCSRRSHIQCRVRGEKKNP